MEKLDRLGWAAGACVTAYGVRLGFRTNEPAVLERVGAVLPPGWRSARSPVVRKLYSIRIGGGSSSFGGSPARAIRHYHLLYGGVHLLARSMDLDPLFGALEEHAQLFVAARARERLFVHAGVVGWHGRAIVIPGRSLAGKSTLVEALVRAGAEYYSDEFAIFDERGRVFPFARPIYRRDRDGGETRTRVSIEDLGGRAGTAPLPVGLVAVSRYRPAARWRPRRLPPGEAVLALLDNTVAARRRPKAALGIFRHFVEQSTLLAGLRGDADETAQALLLALDRGCVDGGPSSPSSALRQPNADGMRLDRPI